VQVESWIPRAVAERLFADAGLDFGELKQAALSRDFRPVALPGARASFALDVVTRAIDSHNVVARIVGAHPEKSREHIVFTAHWDHLGRDPALEGDQIFNGALDNASGTAALLELAEAVAELEQPLDRSVLFLAVTAEEKGLLGSKYYAEHPLWPLETTVANINMDGLNCYGPTNDVVNIGQGFSTLDGLLAAEAAFQDRRVAPDPEPEKGFYFRSDHFSFAKRGVPALYAESGIDYVGKPDGWGRERRERYTTNDYHKVSDEIQADWDLAGAVDDVELYLRVAWRISQADAWPAWHPGTEFAAARAPAAAPR
jgi:Zn-dependent M28 family amino/carboxypeptidase